MSAKFSLYKSLVIYYFSGTGNALKAAGWLAEKALEYGISVNMHSIERFQTVAAPEINGKTLIAFCFPTHGFNAAPLMLKYIVRFPRGSSDVLILNTRGGLKFGKVYFPGLSGLAQFLPMLFLSLKGCRIKGSLPFDMPSNWVSVHPGLTDSAINDITRRRQTEIYRFAERLFKKGYAFSYKFFVYMPLDLAVAPVTLGYYFCGRYMFAKSFYASADCNDCRICIDKCPTNSITLVNNRPFWKYTCESCMRCIGICPNKSIQTAHSFIVPVMYAYSLIPVVASFVNLLGLNTDGGFLQEVLVRVVNWIAVFIFLVITYRIFSFLLKMKFINRIFEYTSLTRYWRRYMAEGVKAGSFKKL
ncbi:MAG: EFR1 family ferrodoxin [Bacteroidetes bacterium]|nr:EFR1 family ferrodoxin [Bacteroidota bacterium]